MKKLLIGLLALGSLSSFGAEIVHSTCAVNLEEDVDYRGSGPGTLLYGPLKGYKAKLEKALENKGYLLTKNSENPINITLRTSYANFYVEKDDGFSLKKKTIFCYVSIDSDEFETLQYRQESKNCKKSLKEIIKEIPNCARK